MPGYTPVDWGDVTNNTADVMFTSVRLIFMCCILYLMHAFSALCCCTLSFRQTSAAIHRPAPTWLQNLMEMLTPPQSGIGEIEFERYTRLTFGQLQCALDSMTQGHSVGGEHLHALLSLPIFSA